MDYPIKPKFNQNKKSILQKFQKQNPYHKLSKRILKQLANLSLLPKPAHITQSHRLPFAQSLFHSITINTCPRFSKINLTTLTQQTHQCASSLQICQFIFTPIIISMNQKVLCLLFMLIFASQAIMYVLPERYTEINDPKEFQLLQRNPGFDLGVRKCQRSYEVAGGGKNAVLSRAARYIESNTVIYYYINLVGPIGLHEFLFKVTSQA